eukprot:TRINITY_DN23703_c0_g1_i2.p1 TRINITY_DN23703_c0_g1~~TRINITY_DN23703_c0_g1_i2.p1  ORF type:complete len:300 (-),score=34.70 TRINITY_DN23703_c0_g1_i2:347-1246(-)
MQMAEPESEQAGDPCPDAARLRIIQLDGSIVIEDIPAYSTVLRLKTEISSRLGMPVACQHLVLGDNALENDSELDATKFTELLLVYNERPTYTWDKENNPCKDMLDITEEVGSHLRVPKLAYDYCNVLTQEPIYEGCHYFQFVMHKIGDEQWCGLVHDAAQAGSRPGGRQLKAWTYYCGRMHCSYESLKNLRDGFAALHAQGHLGKGFQTLTPSGDVIGMLVDLDRGALVFDLNGSLQGGCTIPRLPMRAITHVDTRQDHVELRKLFLTEVPKTSLEALTGELARPEDCERIYKYSNRD